MRNYIYIHVCCINNWKDVLDQLYNNIKSSGLHDVVERIKCNILCKPETKEDVEMYFSELLLADAKLELLGITCNISLYETPTINLLHAHATDSEEEFNVLYLHTKGVTRTSVSVNDWINYMIYFNIIKHKTCIDRLADHDAVGVNLVNVFQLHYSGNFWWSKSSFIRKLKRCEHTHYNSPEFWLTEGKNGNFLSLWDSNIIHYNERYEEDKYKPKSELFK
jgi:hypothetical protein